MKIRLPQELAPLFLRLGVGFVFFMFGIDKFKQPEFWLEFMNKQLLFYLPMSPTTFIYLLGGLETIVGFLLIIGLYTRIAAAIAALNLIGIIVQLGINDATIRDVGLLAAALSLVVTGSRWLSIDSRFNLDQKKKKQEYIQLG